MKTLRNPRPNYALVLLVFVASSMTACGTSDEPEASATIKPPTADESVGCEERVEPMFRFSSDAPGITGANVGDAHLVLAPPGPDFVAPRTRNGDERLWVWKTPLTVSADRSMIVAVNPAQAEEVRLQYAGRDGVFEDFSRVTQFTACDTPTGWAGGFATRASSVCVKLQVWSGTANQPKSVVVPLGQKCSAGATS
ncbi:MAG: hypothetical protein WAO61_02870 [Solirubrobacterales bacterium]